MSNQLPPDADILGTMISQFIFMAYGFGPSQDICLPFARQVITEATRLDRIWVDVIPKEADS